MLQNKNTSNQLSYLVTLGYILKTVINSQKGFVFWFINNIGSIILVVPFIFPVLCVFFNITIPENLFLFTISLGYIISPFLAYHVYHGLSKVLDDYAIHFFGENYNYTKIMFSCIITILILKTLFVSWTL